MRHGELVESAGVAKVSERGSLPGSRYSRGREARRRSLATRSRGLGLAAFGAGLSSTRPEPDALLTNGCGGVALILDAGRSQSVVVAGQPAYKGLAWAHAVFLRAKASGLALPSTLTIF